MRKPVYSKGRSAVKIAMICDQMTFVAFQRECEVVCLTPWNWSYVLQKSPPDFLLCESAWSGIQGSGACWRGRIYRNHKVWFEHRRALLRIQKVCRRMGIPTVFWNKEDPTFFGSSQYDFVDTALHFDYIFTTAEECVAKYQALGHGNVHTLPFGFSPSLFNPLGSGRMRQEAFFAGSWYQDQTERCRDMAQMFRYMEEYGIRYTIYDRNYHVRGNVNQFPEPYRSRCRPAIPYTDLDNATKKYLYGLNINTVRESGTMFARRVYEMMAGNHMIISNYAKGIKKEFPDSVWYCGQGGIPQDDANMRRKNLEHVFRFHTYEKRLDTILNVLGIEFSKPVVQLYLFSENFSGFQNCKVGHIQIEHRAFRGIHTENKLPEEGYAAVLKDGHEGADWPFLMAQFAYLPEDCGVRWGKASYEIVTDRNNWNCIFPVSVLGRNFKYFSESLKKMEI